jgi:hypothetical protein
MIIWGIGVTGVKGLSSPSCLPPFLNLQTLE